MKVGTKDLKNQLSRYLREVRRGHRVYVMDRGRVVAEIRAVSPAQGRTRERLQELAARGDLVLGDGSLEEFAPLRVLQRGARLSAAVLDDRG